MHFSIVAGNPAKQIKLRFKQDVIDQLLEIKWWDWSHEDVVKNASIVVGNDLEKLATLSLRHE